MADKKVDLTDLLPPEDQEEVRKKQAEERAKEELRRTAHLPKNVDRPEALVMFWQEFYCQGCGREYSAPGYHPHPAMVRVLEKDGGEHGCSSYRYERPRPDHPELPLVHSTSLHNLSCCRACVENGMDREDSAQLSLFPEEDSPLHSSTRNSHKIPGEKLLPEDTPISLDSDNQEED